MELPINLELDIRHNLGITNTMKGEFDEVYYRTEQVLVGYLLWGKANT